jgi:outer membrane protein insertion porin family
VGVAGASGVSADQIRGMMSTRAGRPLPCAEPARLARGPGVQRDLQRLTDLYHDRGYINARVHPPRVTFGADRHRATLILQVEEGPQFRLGRLEMTGLDQRHRERLLPRLGLRPGDVFNRSRLASGVAEITRLCVSLGHPRCAVTPRVEADLPGRRLNLVLELKPAGN